MLKHIINIIIKLVIVVTEVVANLKFYMMIHVEKFVMIVIQKDFMMNTKLMNMKDI